MAGFNFSKSHHMCKQELREAAQGLANKLERKYGVRSQWDGDTICIKGSGVDGRLCVSDDKVDVSVKLGLLASAFQSVLKKEVQRYLDENIS